MRELLRNAHWIGKSDELRTMEKQAAAYHAELTALSPEMLERIYADLRNSKHQPLQSPSHRASRRTKTRSGNALADYAFWAKMALWTVTEAVALSLGSTVDIDAISPSPFFEAALLSSVAFVRLKELVTRAIQTGVIARAGKGIVPESYIAWARSHAVDFPAELANLVHQRGAGERDRMAAEKPIVPRERDTFLKLIGGMAAGGYGYDPQASRSSIVKEIHDDLARQGIALDLDTIRNKLKEASRLTADAL
ncbi:hypothetical protein [Capsulimonas corticalis]|nr:hypothetical protein [Capsulimonas corticalis]